MGFRWRKSVRLLPGVRLNFSRSGVSTSIGPRGATLNFGGRGPRATFGLPGTGLSYSTRLGEGGATQKGGPRWGCLVVVIGAALLAMIGKSCSVAPESAAPAIVVPPVVPLETTYVHASSLNCRKGASSEQPVTEQLVRGAALEIRARSEGWALVARPKSDCWVSDQYLTPSPPMISGPLVSRQIMGAVSRSRSTTAECTCSRGEICIGPRGGRYCMISGGRRRYGV